LQPLPAADRAGAFEPFQPICPIEKRSFPTCLNGPEADLNAFWTPIQRKACNNYRLQRSSVRDLRW